MPYANPPYATNPYAAFDYVTVPAAQPSGTNNFNLDLGEIIIEAYERCGLNAVTGNDYRTARRSLDLMMQEWANRGFNLWTVEEGSQALTEGTATYNLDADTVDLTETMLRTGSGANQQDYTLTRISVSTYATIPNKLIQARPTEVYVNRTITPSFTVWPVPDASDTYTLVYWRLRRIYDTGTPASNTMDVPFRFLPALVAGLAYFIAMKKVPEIDKVAALKAVYEEQWNLSAGEDRTRASVRFVPYISQRL